MKRDINKWKSLRLFIAVSLLMGVMVATDGIAVAKDNIHKWRCQSYLPVSSTSYEKSMLAVIQRIKERTNGRFVIEPYAAGSLIPTKEIFNAVKRGMIEIGMSALGYYLDQVPIGAVAQLPYCFKEPWEAAYFLKFRGFEQMARTEFSKQGIFWSSDRIHPCEVVLKKPIKKMEDLNGFKIRASGTNAKFLTSVGAASSYIPGEEIYAALASGVVDGAYWGAAGGAYTMGFYDVCKYHLKPPILLSMADCWLVNQKAIDKLPEDFRKILYWTLEEEFWRRTNQYIYDEKTILAKVQKEKGVTVITLSAEDQEKMTIAAIKLWDAEAKRDPATAKAVRMVKEFLKELGHLK